ncbi:hypothetical protein [Clostridium rectalis]|uniref:hypothetical protein n=1 Tax=Clostridium rectalis TaxID=2040295 RepID=UPI000F638339|nr:hypothetical protein [Clostridium rectalis]
MYITSTSLSYLFLAVGILSLFFFIYFKFIIAKSDNQKIVGTMKNPEVWKNRNSKMIYISLFWTIVSIGIFIYLKFFYNLGLISIVFLISYIVLLLASIILFFPKNKDSEKGKI